MLGKLKWTLLILAVFFVSNAFSLEKEYVKYVFENDNKEELLEQADIAYTQGKLQVAIDILFEVWLTERSFWQYLMTISTFYNDLNKPEMAGIFLLEATNRVDKAFDVEGLKKSFTKVWDDEIFIPFRDKAIAVNSEKKLLLEEK
ncbi:MAG: hypothetical protein FWG20_00530 [Candidatus Cloacimonetes bacterium]|nr:hypothetical protein [Candidatus Cloacimonadota bacterium]